MKKTPSCLGYICDYTTHLCGDYFINHEIRIPIPIKQPGFNGSCHSGGFLGRGSIKVQICPFTGACCASIRVDGRAMGTMERLASGILWHGGTKKWFTVPTKTQLSNFLGTPGEDYFKGNPKSLNFYFLVIWWGKFMSLVQTSPYFGAFQK